MELWEKTTLEMMFTAPGQEKEVKQVLRNATANVSPVAIHTIGQALETLLPTDHHYEAGVTIVQTRLVPEITPPEEEAR